MPNLIYIDASTKKSFCGIIKDQSFTQIIEHDKINEHSKVLHTHIAELLRLSNLSFENIEGIAVMNGPGSYTGLRTALSLAKGICFAQGIPLILLNKLDVLLEQESEQHSKDACILLPAREGEFFFTAYNSALGKVWEAQHIMEAELDQFLEKFDSPVFTLIETLPLNKRETQTEIGKEELVNHVNQRFKAKSFNDIMESEPFYLKKVHISTPAIKK